MKKRKAERRVERKNRDAFRALLGSKRESGEVRRPGHKTPIAPGLWNFRQRIRAFGSLLCFCTRRRTAVC